MSDEDLSEVLAREEAKRERMWDPAERWKVIQDTITWAEAQKTVDRNTPAARLKEQAEKLAYYNKLFPDGSENRHE